MLFRWRSSNDFHPKLPKECKIQPQDEAKNMEERLEYKS